MLNWIEEEKQYIDKAVDNYLEEQSKMPLGFLISDKTLKKNCANVRKEASERYRYEKLMKYRCEIEEERRRINEAVESINKQLNDYVKSIKGNIDKEIKPFKIEVKEYDICEPMEVRATEIVQISCEPFRLSFIQEKLDLESKGE